MTGSAPVTTKSRRSLSLSEIEANKVIFDRYFDPDYAESLIRNVIAPIDKHYFKSKFIGFDTLPVRNNPDRPLIYVSNHSGMAFPWDAMIFSGLLFKKQHFKFKQAVRALSAPMLSQSNLMNPYLIRNFWKINGAVDATYNNLETMMWYQDANLMIYPEGVAGIGKGFNRRYQLQRFATSFVRMALKYQTDIIPYATVNGEYINPYVYSYPWLNRLVQKIGIPYLPVGFHTILLLLFPWLFYFALPAQLTYVMGKRISPSALLDKPYQDMTDDDIKYVRDRIKDQMQQELDHAVARYGKQRFSSGKILRNSLLNIVKLNYFSPPGWPLLFHQHDRLYRKNQGRPFEMKVRWWSGLTFLFKNPFTLFFYIPILGWLPLLIKGYRKNRIGN